jgi:hypothetical protein
MVIQPGVGLKQDSQMEIKGSEYKVQNKFSIKEYSQLQDTKT